MSCSDTRLNYWHLREVPAWHGADVSVHRAGRDGTGLRTGQCAGYVRLRRTKWFGDRIPEGGEIFRTRPERPLGPPSLLYNAYRVFPGGKAAGAWR
jgi:hypothetical protein